VILKFGLDDIHARIVLEIVIVTVCRFGLKLPIHAHLGHFGGILPPNMVTHRYNPQKDHPCAEIRRFSQKA